jgi:putative effector of murein hydrolase LrgA (UPF0299 family)
MSILPVRLWVDELDGLAAICASAEEKKAPHHGAFRGVSVLALPKALKIADHLRDRAHELAHQLLNILLAHLALLPVGVALAAECGLEGEIPAKVLLPPAKASIVLPGLTGLSVTALAGQSAQDLWQQGQHLPHDFTHILRRKRPLVLIEPESRLRLLLVLLVLLRLCEDMRDNWRKLAHDLPDVLLRELTLLLIPHAPGAITTKGGLTGRARLAEGLIGILPVLIAGRLLVQIGE